MKWLEGKLKHASRFYNDLKPERPEKCSRLRSPMRPDEFVRRVKAWGMQNTEQLERHLPSKPSRTSPKARLAWKRHLKPLNICDKTWDSLIPLPPIDASRFRSVEEYNAAWTNWQNYFTDEKLRLVDNKSPAAVKLSCPSWAARELARVAKASKKAKGELPQGSDEIKRANQLGSRKMCTEQVSGVLRIPKKTEYPNRDKIFKADLKLWEGWVKELEKGIANLPPILQKDPSKPKTGGQCNKPDIPKDPPSQPKGGDPTSKPAPKLPPGEPVGDGNGDQDQCEPIIDDFIPQINGVRELEKDLGKDPRKVKTTKDGLCGFWALTASWRWQIPHLPPPSVAALEKVLLDPRVRNKTYREKLGYKYTENWFEFEQLALMLDLWALDKYKIHVQLGVKTALQPGQTYEQPPTLANHIAWTDPQHRGEFQRLWINHNGAEGAFKGHYEGLRRR